MNFNKIWMNLFFVFMALILTCFALKSNDSHDGSILNDYEIEVFNLFSFFFELNLFNFFSNLD